MLEKLKQFILSQDQFGNKFEFPIQGDSRSFNTIFGGLASIVIYGFGFFYFFYHIVLWSTGNIPPKISQIQKFLEDDYNYIFTEPYFAFEVIGDEEFNRDPDKIYFIPKVINLHNFNKPLEDSKYFELTKGTNCKDTPSKVDLTNFYCLDQHLKVGYLPSKPGKEEVISIDLLACKTEYLKPGQVCANDAEMEFFSDIGYIHIIIFLTELDYNTGTYKLVQKSFYLTTSRYEGAKFSFQLSNIEIDKGIIFQSVQKYQTVSNVENQSFIFSEKSKSLIYKEDTVLYTYLITLQPQVVEVNVHFQSLSETFAEFQGLFMFVLYIGVTAQLYSQRVLDNKLSKMIIKRYYPGIEEGQINQILQDQEHFLSRDNITKRLSFQEIFYELIELRFIINIMLSKDQVQQAKFLGLKHVSKLRKPYNEIWTAPKERTSGLKKTVFDNQFASVSFEKVQELSKRRIYPESNLTHLNTHQLAFKEIKNLEAYDNQAGKDNEQEIQQEKNYLQALLQISLEDKLGQQLKTYQIFEGLSFDEKFSSSLVKQHHQFDNNENLSCDINL